MSSDPQVIETRALSVRETPTTPAVRSEDFMPLMSVEQAIQRKTMMNQFIGTVLKETANGEGGDYGLMPGGRKTKILLKPGAEKLCSIFGLAPQYTEDKVIEDWTGADHGGEPLFYYSYRCALMRGGLFMGEAIGSCNSWETKYRYRWVPEDVAKQRPDFERLPKRGGTRTIFEPNFALDKSETSGKYGKPAEYWQRIKDAATSGVAKQVRRKLGTKEYVGYEMQMDETQYRIPNPEVADTINTCQKMAQKRALVAAVLIVTNCSDAFTQDIEDFADDHGTHGSAPADASAHADDAPPPPKENGSPRTPQTNRVIPEDLQAVVTRLQSQPTGANVKAAFRILEDALCEKMGTVAGVAEYKRVVGAFEAAVPAKDRKVGDVVECLVDLWDALQKAEQLPLPGVQA